MAFRLLSKRLFSTTNDHAASLNVKPLRKSDPEAKKPMYVDGKRIFPPTVDEHGNVTYNYEWPAEWKPYSHNYSGHGWLISGQVLLWISVFYYEYRMEEWAEMKLDR